MNALGIYEKALPKGLNWEEKLTLVKELGFHFLEMSIDESDQRLARLRWNQEQRQEVKAAIEKTGVRIQNLMLSGHRRYPLGSERPEIRKKALLMMSQAIELAKDLGVRNIQLAGYDVYYEEKTPSSREYFIENLTKCVALAASQGMMLSIETMDDPFINSISKAQAIKTQIPNPWLQVYPDLGNLSAWPEVNVSRELEKGIANIVAIHLKDTYPVTDTFKGQFKNVPFGAGCVDFSGNLKTLKRLNYSGSLTIEMWSEESQDPLKEIMEAKNFFQKLFTEHGIELEGN